MTPCSSVLPFTTTRCRQNCPPHWIDWAEPRKDPAPVPTSEAIRHAGWQARTLLRERLSDYGVKPYCLERPRRPKRLRDELEMWWVFTP